MLGLIYKDLCCLRKHIKLFVIFFFGLILHPRLFDNLVSIQVRSIGLGFRKSDNVYEVLLPYFHFLII